MFSHPEYYWLVTQYHLLSTLSSCVEEGMKNGGEGTLLTSFLKSIIIGQTGIAHSVIFVSETLFSENSFISDIDEDLRYIFVFGYYLKRKGFVVTLICCQHLQYAHG